MSDKKSCPEPKVPEKVCGGGLAAAGTSVSSGEQQRCAAPSVKKEPLESSRERQGRYSPDYGYQHRLSPHHHPPDHGYHVDKSLLPPSLSGPHSSELHGQKFDFFRGQNSESEAVRGLQPHGLC